MKKYVWILLFICCSALTACSGEPGSEQMDIARFEEQQNNRDHAVKLYQEVVRKYPDSPNAQLARERLAALQETK